jgi:hypothetical protein
LLATKENMTEPFSVNFNKTIEKLEAMKFMDFAFIGDIVFSEMFEGIAQIIDWEPYQMKNIFKLLNGILLNTFNDKARQLYVTKQLLKPLEDLALYNSYIG